jgi:hypothetical protein
VVFVDTPRGVGTLNLALSPAGLKALFACGVAEAARYLQTGAGGPQTGAGGPQTGAGGPQTGAGGPQTGAL